MINYIFINTDFFLETDFDYAELNLSNTKLVIPKLVVKELEKANTEKSQQILKDFERYKELPYFIFDDENDSSRILVYIQQYQCAWESKFLATFSLSLMADNKFWMFYGCREFRNTEIIVSSVSAIFISQIQKSAEEGNIVAQYIFGDCYYFGFGVPQDYHQPVEWYTKAAEQGLASAQCNLGVCYSNGLCVSLDYHQAVKWYTKAAEQGYASAQYNLGVCYYNGQGVPRDYHQAVEWYTKAAEQGYAGAQCNLGELYRKGQGVEVDLIEAAYWYNNAFKNGIVQARSALEYLYSNMPNYDSYAHALVKQYEQRCNEGDIKSMIKLGDSYYRGYGVHIDKSKAFCWFKKAADLGDIEAKCRVGNCYFKGEGVAEDKNKAFSLYFEIVDKDSYVMTFLGECYLKGKHNIKQDIDKAIQYLSAASQKINPDAIKLLADYYYEQKQYKEAIPLLESYKNINPDSYVDVYYKLGKCYQYLGDYKNAIDNLEKHQTGYALYAIGDCYYALAQQYEQEHPDDKNIWKDLYRQAQNYYLAFCQDGNDVSAELQKKIMFCFNKYK